MSIESEGGEFLHNINSTLHTQDPVEHAQKEKRKFGEETSNKPSEKINDWLEVIEKTHTGHRDKPEVAERIKNFYHKEYVVKPEDIPQSYWNSVANMMINEGRGGDLEQAGVTERKYKIKEGIEKTDYIFPENLVRQQVDSLISDQKSTLDLWVDYLTSPDSDVYPTWAKYWAFTGMLKLSTFDKEKHVFGKRDKGTVAPFADLNREALAYTIDVITKKARKEGIPEHQDNPEFLKILQTNNFGKIYAYAIEKITPTEQNELLETRGKWVKYPQGSDHMPLVNSLQGYGTGWCTAGESTAQAQLEMGDFYVYYSYDKNGKPVVPRVAIRMYWDKIGEVRGVAENQNLDPYINDVVDRKLKEFEDGDNYKIKLADMRKLTEIDKKFSAGRELTLEDLYFLHEIDHEIQGFGYSTDPRIEKILSNRNILDDLINIYTNSVVLEDAQKILISNKLAENISNSTLWDNEKTNLSKAWEIIENKGDENTAYFLAKSISEGYFSGEENIQNLNKAWEIIENKGDENIVSFLADMISYGRFSEEKNTLNMQKALSLIKKWKG